MKKHRFVLFIMCGFLLFSSCKKKEEVKSPEPPPKPQLPIEVPPPKYETYQYLDMGRRDPFVSLIEEGVSKKGELEVVIEEKEEKTGLEGWALSGLIWDKKEKMAVVKGQEGSYLFAYGTLSDRNGEPVPDVKAKIKDDGILLVKNKKDIFLKIKEKTLKEEDTIQ